MERQLQFQKGPAQYGMYVQAAIKTLMLVKIAFEIIEMLRAWVI